jgi:hypothetical protein
MKKLISALTVKQAHKDGIREISAPKKSTIITPEARSVAKALGLTFADSTSPVSNAAANVIDENLVRKIVEKVVMQLPPENRDPDTIRDVVVEILAKYVK